MFTQEIVDKINQNKKILSQKDLDNLRQLYSQKTNKNVEASNIINTALNNHFHYFNLTEEEQWQHDQQGWKTPHA